MKFRHLIIRSFSLHLLTNVISNYYFMEEQKMIQKIKIFLDEQYSEEPRILSTVSNKEMQRRGAITNNVSAILSTKNLNLRSSLQG